MNFIVAVSQDYAIGYKNKLLFNLPSDLIYFKQKTMGKVVVMGERTYLSLPKRPLPGRINIVLSDNPNFNEEGVTIVRSVKDLFNKLENFNTDDVFVCGGASVYNLLMEYCEIAYITKVQASAPADTFINNIEEKGNWNLIEKSEPVHENGLTFTFNTYQNKDIKKFQ